MPIICFGEQYYYSDGNNITPPANTAVVTATNNINNELGRSLMDETFPQNQQIYLPELQNQETVSALTALVPKPLWRGRRKNAPVRGRIA